MMISIQRSLARKRLLAQMKKEQEAMQAGGMSKAEKLLGLKPRASMIYIGEPTQEPLSDDSPPRSTSANASPFKKKNNKSNRMSKKSIAATMKRSKSAPPPGANLFSFTYVSQPADSIRTKFPLTDHQRSALRITWSKMMKTSKNSGRGIVTVMECAFEKMLDKDKKLKEVYFGTLVLKGVFNHEMSKVSTLRDHANFIATWLGEIIGSLNLNNVATLNLPAIQKHAQLKPVGLESRHWEYFGEALCDTMFTQSCVRAYPEAAKAWLIFIASLTDILRHAFDRQRVQLKSKHKGVKVKRKPTVLLRSVSEHAAHQHPVDFDALFEQRRCESLYAGTGIMYPIPDDEEQDYPETSGSNNNSDWSSTSDDHNKVDKDSAYSSTSTEHTEPNQRNRKKSMEITVHPIPEVHIQETANGYATTTENCVCPSSFLFPPDLPFIDSASIKTVYEEELPFLKLARKLSARAQETVKMTEEPTIGNNCLEIKNLCEKPKKSRSSSKKKGAKLAEKAADAKTSKAISSKERKSNKDVIQGAKRDSAPGMVLYRNLHV